MSKWKGYFFKATLHSQIFPLSYIEAESWSSTPNQREEIKAYRDDNTRNLTRVTASGKKSVFSFSTRENLHDDDITVILKFFTDNENDPTQRRITLEYWNDEERDYKTGDFYRPDIKYEIKQATSTDLIYKPLQIECVEY